MARRHTGLAWDSIVKAAHDRKVLVILAGHAWSHSQRLASSGFGLMVRWFIFWAFYDDGTDGAYMGLHGK